MIRTSSVVVALAAVLAVAPARAGDQVLFGPPPEWVVPVEADMAGDEEPGVPVRILLFDSQRRMEGARETAYSSVAMRFQTPEGLQGGNISLPWRADSDELTVHKVLIHRGGETIDVLGAGQTFTVLRREQNLEMAMLDGVLTANMFPEGLQVGDVLEVATTVVSNDPVLAGHNEASVGPLNAPFGRVRVRLQWPSSAKVQLTRTDDLPEWKRSRDEGFETAELDLRDIEPIPLPGDAPVRYGMVRFAQASDFASWAELAAIFEPLYREAARVPAEGPLRAEVERIRAASSDPIRQAEAALVLVESRIRYVALAMGDGGLVPANAADTWARRYGDCKAKTALLLAILGELGIEAEAVVVNAVVGDTVSRHLPGVSAFNHVIVRAHIGGRDYWLDGTRTGDTSLARLQVPAFGWGLPIRPGAELVRMVPAPLEEPNEDLAIRMDASKGVRGPVPTTVEVTLRGDGALALKQALASFTGEARDRELRGYWRDRFRDIEPQTVADAFDEATGELRLTLAGTATMDWNGIWYETDETAVGFQADFTREPGPAADAPYAVPYPFFRRTRQTIVLPEGYASPLDADAPIDETVAGREYKRHATLTGNTFFIERTARSVAPEFAAAEAPAAQKRLRELWDKPVHLRMPAATAGAPGPGVPVVTTAPPTDNVDQLITEGNDLLDIGQYDEALARFTRATELAPGSANAWADRGITLAHKGSFDEALVDLGRAAALEPRNAVVFRGRGLVAERRQDFPAAVAAFTTAIEIEPGSAFSWAHRAFAHMGGSDADRALADAAEAIKLAPDWAEMYGLRAFVLNSQGKRREAEREIDALLAAAPDKPAALTVAGNFYAMVGMNDKARDLVERAVGSTPTPMALFNRARLRDPADTAGKLADLDKALELMPGFEPALAARADLRRMTGDAEGAFADVVAATDTGGRVPRQMLALKADLARRLGRREEAIAAAAAIMANEPESSAAYAEASRAYAALGMYAEAVAAVDKALEINPEPFLYLDRAAARDPADFDARLTDIEAALKRSPNYADGIGAKARLLSERGDHAGAVRVFGQAMALRPNDADLLVQRGIALAKAGRTREADRDFAQARTMVGRAPPEFFAPSLNNLCYVKAVAGVGLERALAECNEALRLVPDHAPTLDSRGTVLLRLNRFDEAIADFDRAIEKMPGMVPSRYLRAVARSNKGDAEGARADLEAARKIDAAAVERLQRNGFVLAAGGRAAEAAPAPTE